MSKTAFIFSGQGAQTVGMGRDLAEAFPACADLFKRADDVLGYGLSAICFEGPDEELTLTKHCQPAIFLTSLAALTALRERGVTIEMDASAGLSLGEWTALHAAGALSFDDALRALEARGRFMQEACDETPGAMVSVIGLDLGAAQALAADAGAEIANVNAPGQIVLSGAADAVQRAADAAKPAGAKMAVMLNVAGAYHSSLMAGAAERLADFLADVEISTPRVPVASNASGALHGDPAAIREALVKQVTSPVEWVKCVETLNAAGLERYVECGPGRVLTGLIKRIDRSKALHNIQGLETLDAAVGALEG